MNGNEQENARAWASGCHLAAFVGLIGLPLGNLIGPLLVWLWKKDTFPLVQQEGKQALNFQISMSLYALIVLFITYFSDFEYSTLLLLTIIIICDYALVIRASIRVSQAKPHKYPFSIRFIK